MKGAFFRQRLTAISLLSIQTSGTLLLTGTALLWPSQKSWATLGWEAEKQWRLEAEEKTPQVAQAQTQSVPPPPQTIPVPPPPGTQYPLPVPQSPFPGAPVTSPEVPFELQNTPQRFQTNPQFGPYRLGVGDAISVVIPRFPDLTFQATINPEGNILAPLLGNVAVRGLTLEEVQEKLRVGFNRYVIDPQVTVGLVGQRPVQITITGEIFRPGYYNIGFPPRLTTALLSAGGSTTNADLRQIRVRRFLVDGSFIEQRIDLFTPLAAGDPLPEFRLEDGDAVIIPKLEVGNDQTYNRQLVAGSTIAQPTINIRILSYPNQGVGAIRLPNGSNFLDAFTAASPSLINADINAVAVIRFDPERGRAIVRELNAKRALFGDASQNIPLRDNDVIVIGRNLVGRLTYALNIFTQPFRDILGFLLFFQELTDNATNLFRPGFDNRDR